MLKVSVAVARALPTRQYDGRVAKMGAQWRTDKRHLEFRVSAY